MKKKLIVFATECEASESLALLQATRMSDDLPLYSFSKGWLLLSGIGLFSTYHALLITVHHIGDRFDEVINLGFAASLHDEKIGEIFPVGSVGKYTLFPDHLDRRSVSFYQSSTPFFQWQQGKRLLTCEFPVHDVTIKQTMQKEWDLVDMEGYAIAHAALMMKKKMAMYKIISDFAMQGGPLLIEQHKQELSKKIAAFTMQMFASSAPTSF